MTVAGERVAQRDVILGPESLARYADAAVRGSLGLNAGDVVQITGAVAHRDFAVALVEAAYRAGAKHAEILYSESRTVAARVRYGSDESLGHVTPWDRARLRGLLGEHGAVMTITGEADPGVYDGLPPERLAADAFGRAQQLRFFSNAVRDGKLRWVGLAWPTAHWAGEVYPELDPLEAQRRLARDILWFCRLGPDDPPGYEGWVAHTDVVSQRAETLTELQLDGLEIRGPGTELRFRLAPGTRWAGGYETTAFGQRLCPNMPTEENFTSPDAAATEGTFRCSRPLSFRGRVIDGLTGEFKRGKLVRLEADRDEDRDFLAAFLDSVPNAKRIGEVALVDSTSRIGQAQRTYSNTLIDENAVAHIAFGLGFAQTRPEGTGRLNRSAIHVDVMIGSDDLEVTGVLAGGRRLPLIADGTWQVP